jgi:predicted RNA binding protein YcfA (HicA-like mRNA interferase family)
MNEGGYPRWQNYLPFRPREVVRFLEQYGFVLDRNSGSHFIFFHPVSKRRAVVPKHNRDMPKGTRISLLRKAGFTREEMIAFLAN